MSGIRRASHAGSWYTHSSSKLNTELDEWLSEVPDKINESDVPIKGASVIIAPHAGYSYSGPCAAWAYKVFDVSAAKRIFVLGPSHTYYLSGCALTTYATYETPLGNLRVDLDTIKQLRDTGKFKDIPRDNDEDEHSLEMHLPYLAKRLTQTFGGGSDGDGDASWPPVVPILIGDNKRDAEKAFGELLLPHLRDPDNAFIVSSDFCHWGSRFSYTKYTADGTVEGVRSLGRADRNLPVPIHEGIRVLDHLAMDAIETGSHDAFYDNLKATGNTVCGRHPIGVVMAALEMLKKERAGGDGAASGSKKGDGVFTFVKYDRSSLVENVSDSSVSYAAAYAVI
ncbi:hypothetical protein PoMZ_06335 [Pyricularia oryzae]|uniref:DUF52 domain-containing protein n=1 Tax=Pyricularia oryzae TaxID=318829 RepID=A0A4P7NQL3_PYROR|nr:hypothetical protein PoMZ_06335 [Pyricularia oryzae]